MRSFFKIVALVAGAAALSRLVKRVWLLRQGTEVEPSPHPEPPRQRSESRSGPDPVDEAIAESFPASDPPSYTAGVDQH